MQMEKMLQERTAVMWEDLSRRRFDGGFREHHGPKSQSMLGSETLQHTRTPEGWLPWATKVEVCVHVCVGGYMYSLII